MLHKQVHYAGLFFTLLLVWNKEHAIFAQEIVFDEGDDEIKDVPQHGLDKR